MKLAQFDAGLRACLSSHPNGTGKHADKEETLKDMEFLFFHEHCLCPILIGGNG
jgi:hypothetical protein